MRMVVLNSLFTEKQLEIEMRKDGQVKYSMDPKCKYSIGKLYRRKMLERKAFGVMIKK